MLKALCTDYMHDLVVVRSGLGGREGRGCIIGLDLRGDGVGHTEGRELTYLSVFLLEFSFHLRVTPPVPSFINMASHCSHHRIPWLPLFSNTHNIKTTLEMLNFYCICLDVSKLGITFTQLYQSLLLGYQ